MPKISEEQVYRLLTRIVDVKGSLRRLAYRYDIDGSARYLDAMGDLTDVMRILEDVRCRDKRRGIKRL